MPSDQLLRGPDLVEHILNHSPAIAFLWRAAAGWPVEFVTANVRQFGYEPGDFVDGRLGFADIIHPDDQRRARDMVRRNAAGHNDQFELSCRVVTRERQTRWVDAHMWLHRDARGRVTHYHGIALDVTDRRLLEDVLDEEKHFIYGVFNRSPDGIIVIRRDGRFIAMNPAVRELFGFETAGLRKLNDLLRLLFPGAAVRRRVREAWRRAVRNERLSARCIRAATRDRGALWVRFQMAPMGGGHMLLTCQDVTDVKQTETALRRARSSLEQRVAERTHELAAANERLRREVEERLRGERALRRSQQQLANLAANIPGVVYRCKCDRDWTMTYISAGIEELCGYTAASFMGNAEQTFLSVIHPDDRTSVEEGVLSAVAERRPFALRYRVVHADGSVRWVTERGQALFGRSGAVRWLDGVILQEAG